MQVRPLSEEMLRVASVDSKPEKDFEFDRVLAPEEGQEKVRLLGRFVGSCAAPGKDGDA